jgi:hypothetical protein
VFGDHNSSAGGSSSGGGDEGGGGGDVEGAAGVGAGAAGVCQDAALGFAEWDGGGCFSHGVDKAGDLGGGFAAGGEGAEESGEFDLGGFSAEDGVEELGGFGAGEGLVAFDDSFEVGLEGHWLKRSRWAAQGCGPGVKRETRLVAFVRSDVLSGDVNRLGLTSVVLGEGRSRSREEGNI